MKNKSILLFVLFQCLIVSVYPQQAKYTLDEAITEALKNNTNVKVALLDVTKAQAAVSEAFGYALPTVDLSTQFSRFLQTPKMPFPISKQC